jgi:Flp pilus assembly pilin Flp
MEVHFMRRLFLKLWKDDDGALIATEWVFVATILVLGAITGLISVRQAVLTELENFAGALASLSQSYSFSGQSNCQASTAGSQFYDPAQSILISSTPAQAGANFGTPCD